MSISKRISAFTSKISDVLFGRSPRPSPIAGIDDSIIIIKDITDQPEFNDTIFKVYDVGDNHYRINYITKDKSERTMVRTKGKTMAFYISHIKQVMNMLKELKDAQNNELADRAAAFISRFNACTEFDNALAEKS